MTRIGVLSDTHGLIDPKYREYFAECDEIWHAGDIGSMEVADYLEEFKPLRAVSGNIDDYRISQRFPKIAQFKVEDVAVLMTHIGGYPGHYDPSIRARLYACRPQIFVAGHSHILKVMYDKNLNCLHINPGAAGNSGFHAVRTLVRFAIDGKEIKELEVIEIERAKI